MNETLDSDREALEALVVDNKELLDLEGMTDPFNIFEAVGMTRQELRHSKFLAYLLDPNENHGLGDRFTRTFLQAVVARHPQRVAVSAIDLELWDLAQMEVRREWMFIDILLRDEKNKFAVIIENKIGTGEHSGQLRRYREEVERTHTGWRVVPLFLTPEGALPQNDDQYIPVNYQAVCATLEAVLGHSGSSIAEEVRTAISHYIKLLRRHVVEDSEIVDLCQRIYARHKRAMDLIIEHRPDMQAEVRRFLERLIDAEPVVVKDKCAKQWIRFAYPRWDNPVHRGDGWVPSRRMVLFEFNNEPDRLTLRLMIGPGDDAVRRGLFDHVLNRSPFNPKPLLQSKWMEIWRDEWVARGGYVDGAALEEFRPLLEGKWGEFMGERLPELRAILEELPELADAAGREPSDSPRPTTLEGGSSL